VRKPDPTEEALSALRALRESGDHEALLRDLPLFLRNKSSAVVARAAELAGTAREISFAAPLVEAFRRVLPHAPKRDPGCRALTNIAYALVQMEAGAAEVFAIGIRYQQWEASWGPPVDAASGLRAVCAMGLVAIGDPDALLACCDLLNDHAKEARTGAVRALGASGRPDAELLLRYKARLGDKESEVIGEVFRALLNLGPRERSVPYVAQFLREDDDELAESAALALGEARIQEAVAPLREAFDAGGTLSRTGAMLWALTLSRNEDAAAFCFDQLESGRPSAATQALEALALYKADNAWREKVRTLLDRRHNAGWEAIWEEKWQ